MKFYDCASAPSPRRVRVFMAEKGITLPTIQVDLRGGEHLDEAFRKINPTSTVPVLVLDDGTVIYETVAVCRYLEEAYPDPPLLGIDAKDKALVALWDHRCEIEGFLAVSEAFRNEARGLRDRAITGLANTAQIPELAARGKVRIGRFFDVLNERLSESAFVAGPRYTMADITAMISVAFAAWCKIPMTDSQPHLKRWFDAVSARPSAKA
jgi:glutathione S-transferase